MINNFHIEKRKYILIMFGIIIFLLCSLLVGYAYFKGNIGSGLNTNINASAKTSDHLTFINGDALALNATQFNFTKSGSSLTSSTTSSAKLIANTNTSSANDTYQVYINITSNTYNYTTVGLTPEIILSITDPTGDAITSVPGLTYVTSGGVSGFDITNKTGLYQIYGDYAISTTSSTTGTTQEWNATLTYVNLDSDQSANASKSMTAELLLQKEKKILTYKIYGKSIQNGTPSTSSPVYLNSLGDTGTITLRSEDNMFTNGYGENGDNTNFNQLTYSTDTPENYMMGSFEKSSNTSTTIIGNEFIPVDTSLSYDYSLYAKNTGPSTATYYIGIAEYDVDKNNIAAYNVKFIPNTLTYLTQDLKNGDTIVHLNSTANFVVTSSTPSYQRGLIFWNYKDSTGYQYPSLAYSRNIWTNLYTYDNVNKTNNTITLTSAWSHGTITSGTYLSQSSDGGNYNYGLKSNGTLSSTWTKYSITISGNNSNNLPLTGFRPGTKYIKFLSLDNYNNTSGANSFYAGIKFALSSSTIKTDSVTLSEPLRCIDSICDYFDYNNQNVVRKITKKSFTGQESSWSYASTYSKNNYSSFSINSTDLLRFYQDNNPFLCSHLPKLFTNWNLDQEGASNGWADNQYSWFKVLSTTAADLSSWKSWLAAQNTANTPVTIYYQLETPITESITLPMYSKQSEYTKIYITDGTMKSNNVGY
jgi:hypothetical protein